jgi:hypothetical protein
VDCGEWPYSTVNIETVGTLPIHITLNQIWFTEMLQKQIHLFCIHFLYTSVLYGSFEWSWRTALCSIVVNRVQLPCHLPNTWEICCLSACIICTYFSIAFLNLYNMPFVWKILLNSSTFSMKHSHCRIQIGCWIVISCAVARILMWWELKHC